MKRWTGSIVMVGCLTCFGGVAFAAKPDGTNTGYKNAVGYPGSLGAMGAGVTPQSNQTYSNLNYVNGVSVPSGVNNVTFYGCRFASNATADANSVVSGDNIKFDYCTFEPSAKSAPPVTYFQGYQYGIDQRGAGKLTIDHSDFWGWGNGIQFGSSTQAKPFVVRNSWFHDARDDNSGTDHTDAILSNCGLLNAYVVFDNNTIVSYGNTQGLALQTDPGAYCGSNNGGYSFVTITNNYFSGFGYTVAIGENIRSTNITFVGNTFGTDIQPIFGLLYDNVDWNNAINTWKCNTINFVSGTTWTTGGWKPVASDDGKFWTPNGVSSTDWLGNTDCGGTPSSTPLPPRGLGVH